MDISALTRWLEKCTFTNSEMIYQFDHQYFGGAIMKTVGSFLLAARLFGMSAFAQGTPQNKYAIEVGFPFSNTTSSGDKKCGHRATFLGLKSTSIKAAIAE